MIVERSVVTIKDKKVIVDNGREKKTYDFQTHEELGRLVTNYFTSDIGAIRMQLLRGSRTTGYTGGLYLYLKYREGVARKFIANLKKVYNTNKSCRITIRKEI